MGQQNLKHFNPVRQIYNVIGTICNDTEMLKDSNVQLQVDDFMQDLHKIVFGAVNNIVYNGSGDNVTNVTAKDIDNYLSSLPTKYKVWTDQKGYEYVENCIEHANKETFWQSYNRVKKMAVLREYQKMGFDVSDIYDWNTEDFLSREQSLVELDKMELKDIFEHFSLKQLKIKDSYNIETIGKQFKAGTNIQDLLNNFKKGIEYGAPYPNEFENFLVRGQRKGKFVLRSGSTGSLKTSISIANMTNNAVTKIYKDGEWVYNGKSLPSLFISTELDQDELNVIVLANMTGIPRKVIQDGLFTKEQESILLEAGRILEESPLHLYHIPDFSVADIEDIIERNILDNDVQYIAFDYIQSTPKLVRTTNEIFSQNQREDQILLYLSSSLKTLAERYSVYIESSTQLNRNAKDETMRDATALRGSSAVADKVDYGCLLFRAKDSDREKVSDIIENNGFKKEPNYMRYVYKSRSSRADLILWSYMNASTVREECLFATDLDYNIVEEVEKLSFEYKDGRSEKDIQKEHEYAQDDKTRVFGDIEIQQDELDF